MIKLLLLLMTAALIGGCAQQSPAPPRSIDSRSATCAKAEYPNAARRYDAEGTTRLSFTVDSAGLVSNPEVDRPSGTTTAHQALDRAAQQTLLTCRFPPAPGYGPAKGHIEYVWKLEARQSYAEKIRATFRSHLVATEPIDGDPTAEVELRAAPDGRILNTRLLKPSGAAHWDDVVQRALEKVERLPLDVDGKVPPILVLTLRPNP